MIKNRLKDPSIFNFINEHAFGRNASEEIPLENYVESEKLLLKVLDTFQKFDKIDGK